MGLKLLEAMAIVTASDRGPLLNLASWITMVSVSLFVGVKVYTKWTMARKVQFDDVFVILATVTLLLLKSLYAILT